jgi:hypothetical protein
MSTSYAALDFSWEVYCDETGYWLFFTAAYPLDDNYCGTAGFSDERFLGEEKPTCLEISECFNVDFGDPGEFYVCDYNFTACVEIYL